jgi:hypothetical protein
MKKLFLNPKFLHGFYASVVAIILSYFLFFAQKNKNQFDKEVFKETIDNLDGLSDNLHKEIDETAKAYRNKINLQFASRTDFVDEYVSKLIQDIDNQKVESNDDVSKIDDLHQKIVVLNDSIHFYVDSKDKDYFEKSTYLKILLSESDFWNNLKNANKGDKSFIFDKMKIGLLNEKCHYFTYVARHTGGIHNGCGGYLLAINPYQNSVRVGEKFEADMGIMEYSVNIPSVNYVLDNDTLLCNNGVARFQKIFSKPGKYTIRPRAYIENPYTHQSHWFSRDYEINVLPK